MTKRRIEIASGPDRKEFTSMFLEKTTRDKSTGRGNVFFLLDNARIVSIYIRSIERLDDLGKRFKFTGELDDKKVTIEYSFDTRDGYILF